jgi:dynein heavy chain 1
MLKNVHLQSKWLVQLEKQLYHLDPSPNFRLFLTMEMSTIPGSLVQMCFKMVFEPPAGVVQALKKAYLEYVSEERSDRAPKIRSKLHFLAIWLHSVAVERLRYLSIGWSKFYEFN